MWPSQTVRLRPLAVGERIDAAIKIVRSSFLTLAKAALVVGVPSGIVVAFLSASVHSSQENLLTTGANGTNLHTGALYPVLGGDLLTFVIALIVSAFVTVVCFRVIANAYLGQPAEWREALRFGWSRLGAVIWITLLSYLAIAGIVVAVALLIALSVAIHLAVLTALFAVIFGIAAFVAVIWFAVASRLAVPVLMLEGLRGTKAIGRALSLCRGYWWSVFGTQFLAGILVAVASGAVAILFGAIFSVFHGSTIAVVGEGFVVQTISYVVFAPFSAAILIVLSIDLKVRKEGFDIELLSAQMGVPASPTAFFFAKPAPGGYGQSGYPPPPGYPPPSGYPPPPGYPPGYGYPPTGYPQQQGYPPPGYPPPPDYPPPGYPQQPSYPPQSWPQQPTYPNQTPPPAPTGPPATPEPTNSPRPPASGPTSTPGWPRPSDSKAPQAYPSPMPPSRPGWPRPSDSASVPPSYRPPPPPVPPSPPTAPPPPVMPPGWPRPSVPPGAPSPGVSPPDSEPPLPPESEDPDTPGTG
jgi:hypothetical protein